VKQVLLRNNKNGRFKQNNVIAAVMTNMLSIETTCSGVPDTSPIFEWNIENAVHAIVTGINSETEMFFSNRLKVVGEVFCIRGFVMIAKR
jgi:hypothetical protein